MVNRFPSVTAAIVNYNGRHLLETCFRTLTTQEGIRLEILFIDNASTDESVAYVRETWPQARVIANEKNLGYSGALNQAVDLMSGDYLLALNTDIHLTPRFAAELASCIERHRSEGCGYAQGKILFMSETEEKTDRFYSTGHLIPLNRLVYNRGSGQRDQGQFDREERVPGANCACLLMARDLLEDLRTELGVFDPLFPMYGGDVDFDWVANCRGWKPWYCPTALAYHIGEASSHVSKKGFNAAFFNNRFLIMVKNDRVADVLRDLPRILKRNIQDYIGICRVNPRLVWAIPLDLLKHLPAAWRSRRITRHLRQPCAIEPRKWMRILPATATASGVKRTESMLTFWKNQYPDLDSLNDTVQESPRHLWIEPTSRCNTRCRHCAHFHSQFGVDMSHGLFEKGKPLAISGYYA
ncbi:glycosyltransferase [bacterium]|nr:glycosyltransferase [bacterium]